MSDRNNIFISLKGLNVAFKNCAILSGILQNFVHILEYLLQSLIVGDTQAIIL